jgi:hypothetical protein
MKLERCRDQPSKALDEFYGSLAASDHPESKSTGEAMLALLARLRMLDDPRQVWGLTSHYRLCLLARNTYQSPWYVIIIAISETLFAIEQFVGDHQDYERVQVGSLDAAVTAILRAMDQSCGWAGEADVVPAG